MLGNLGVLRNPPQPCWALCHQGGSPFYGLACRQGTRLWNLCKALMRGLRRLGLHTRGSAWMRTPNNYGTRLRARTASCQLLSGELHPQPAKVQVLLSKWVFFRGTVACHVGPLGFPGCDLPCKSQNVVGEHLFPFLVGLTSPKLRHATLLVSLSIIHNPE